ncbi:MAG: GH36-type glycosyl hydrolase domain-containing protein [Bacteroidales bacterium]
MNILFLFVLVFLQACSGISADQELAKRIRSDTDFEFVRNKAFEVVQTGFTAGDGYGEVWIRDFNTFIELACEVHGNDEIRDNLLVFFRMQGEDGNIMDGFIPIDNQTGGYDYILSENEPRYAGHKNDVETDHESSLIQAVYKYIQTTGDKDFLQETVNGISVAERLMMAVDFLLKERFSEEYGLIWGATTADWGDVQPEHEWGVFITDDTHFAIDIYDNAMFLIALENLSELLPDESDFLMDLHDKLSRNTMVHLWDESGQKFVPHLYLEGSPFPADFDENAIYQHGGTAVAIEAGLLTKDQIQEALNRMIDNMEAAGAATIGLTLYPPYPEGFFLNPSMTPYGYQNGGDWTWFGGRMIQQLIKYGFIEEAYEQVQPMMERVRTNNGFYEWYTIANEPRGSGTFRGSAGVLYKSILLFEEWTESL